MERLEIKTIGFFENFEDISEELHRIAIQIHNEVYSHLHRTEDEQLLTHLLEDLSMADTRLKIIMNNECNVRKL